MNFDFNKIPPQAIEFEESILAGCILFPSQTIPEIIDLLLPEHFYRTAHQKIYRAICEMYDMGEPVELPSLFEALKAKGDIEAVGGAVYLSQLADAPVPSDPVFYADKIREKADLRKTIELCHGVMVDCFEVMAGQDLIERLQVGAAEILRGSKIDKFLTKNELTHLTIDRIEKKQRQEQGDRIPTGFPSIDRATGGGFLRSKLVTMSARPGHGKTAMLCCMVANMASRGIKCGVFEIEMDASDLDERWLAAGAKINCTRLMSTSQLITSDEWTALLDAAEEQSGWPVLVDDTGGITIAELKRRARKMVAMGCQIIFIDQLSKIAGAKNSKDDVFSRYRGHVEELGTLKKELRVPIVLLAQISRKFEDRAAETRRPKLTDLKMTGQLEEESDIVLLGYRKYEDTKDEADINHAEWQVAKNRQGPTCIIDTFQWDGRYMKFFEVAKEYQAHSWGY